MPAGKCHVHLAGRGHVDTVHQPAEMPHHGRHRVGLHRIVNFDRLGQRGAQFLYLSVHHRAIVGVEGRATDFLCDRRHLAAADEQFAILSIEIRMRCVLCEVVEHGHWAVNTVLNCAARAGRSNFPFGLRGS